MPGATNMARVARLILLVTALSIPAATGCDETSDSGPSKGAVSGGTGGRPDAAAAGGGAGTAGAAGGGGAYGGVVDAPSSDDSGMALGNSVAAATGVHAVVASTATANIALGDRPAFLELRGLRVIGFCSPVVDLHAQTLAVRYPGHSAFEF